MREAICQSAVFPASRTAGLAVDIAILAVRPHNTNPIVAARGESILWSIVPILPVLPAMYPLISVNINCRVRSDIGIPKFTTLIFFH
jgi:hypothetical protein